MVARKILRREGSWTQRLPAPTPEEELAMIDAQLAEEEPSIDC